MSVSWPVWARGVKGLTPSQSLVLFELARLADARGVVICAVDHLVEATGVARRSVFRALAGLEERGVLSRKMRYRGGKQASSRFVLHLSAIRAGASCGARGKRRRGERLRLALRR